MDGRNFSRSSRRMAFFNPPQCWRCAFSSPQVGSVDRGSLPLRFDMDASSFCAEAADGCEPCKVDTADPGRILVPLAQTVLVSEWY
jgi:hypothetical protein